MLVVYSDPKDKIGHENVLKSMIDVQKHFPIDLKSDSTGDLTINKDKDLIFVLTEEPNLRFFEFKSHYGSPQAMLMPTEGFNTYDIYLKNLKVFDDVTPEEWKKKADNADEEFKVDLEKDNQQEQNRKQSMAGYQNMRRFMMDKKYFTPESDVIKNTDKLKDFINDCMQNKDDQSRLYFESTPLPKEYPNIKQIVGSDFDKMMFTSNQEKANLILILHPNQEKNLDLLDVYNKFAAKNDLKKKIIPSYLEGVVNEPEGFKCPQKLPAIVYI